MPRLQRDLTVRGDLTVGRGGSVRRPATTHSFPFAGELQDALADGFAEGLVGGDGVEPFGLRLALVSQEVNQTQRLTRSSQRRKPRHNEVSRFAKPELVAAFGILLKSSRHQLPRNPMSHAHHFSKELAGILERASASEESLAGMVHANQEGEMGQLYGREGGLWLCGSSRPPHGLRHWRKQLSPHRSHSLRSRKGLCPACADPQRIRQKCLETRSLRRTKRKGEAVRWSANQIVKMSHEMKMKMEMKIETNKCH